MELKIGKQQRKTKEKKTSLQVNKSDKPLTRKTKKSREKTQITNISSETEDIPTDLAALKNIQWRL